MLLYSLYASFKKKMVVYTIDFINHYHTAAPACFTTAVD